MLVVADIDVRCITMPAAWCLKMARRDPAETPSSRLRLGLCTMDKSCDLWSTTALRMISMFLSVFGDSELGDIPHQCTRDGTDVHIWPAAEPPL